MHPIDTLMSRAQEIFAGKSKEEVGSLAYSTKLNELLGTEFTLIKLKEEEDEKGFRAVDILIGYSSSSCSYKVWLSQLVSKECVQMWKYQQKDRQITRFADKQYHHVAIEYKWLALPPKNPKLGATMKDVVMSKSVFDPNFVKRMGNGYEYLRFGESHYLCGKQVGHSSIIEGYAELNKKFN